MKRTAGFLNRLQAKQAGFSLMELLIVVAIIGILASIALPGYANYVRQGKASEATSVLADMKVRIEQFYQDNRTYVGAPCTPRDVVKFFDFACSAVTATTFTITANPKANADMANFQFTINQDGAKTSKYQGTVGATCWLRSKTGTC